MKLDVIAFGEILWDIFETKSDSFERELGGAPANLAAVLARVGVRAAVIGGLGRDRFGDALAAFLADEGVDTRFLLRFPNRTGITFVFRDSRGEPSFLFYRHDTADMAVRRAHMTRAMGKATWALVGTSTLVSRGLASATRLFVKNAREERAHLVVDLNVRAHLWKSPEVMLAAISRLVSGAALLKASLADFAALGVGDEAAGLAWVRARAPRATVVVTRGAARATAHGPHGEAAAPGKKARCVDATGAGDAFLAGVLATLLAKGATPGTKAWSEKATWTEALQVGHSLAVQSVSEVGAVRGVVALAPVRARLRRLTRS